MTTPATEELKAATSTATESEREVEAEVVVPANEKLDRDEISKIVGAKNVMGTCSG